MKHLPKDWFDFYGYIDIPKTFDWGNGSDKGIWSDGSPLFMEIGRVSRLIADRRRPELRPV